MRKNRIHFLILILITVLPIAAVTNNPELSENAHADWTTSEQKPNSFPMSPAIKAAADAPNILLVMTDDVGFGAVSTFGGSIPKPHLDRLAERGLSYNRFHTTGICSTTRAALLTGRNHHAVGTGAVVEMSSPFPGYTGVIPNSASTIARILRDSGYSTAMFGKDHNVPNAHRSPAGPFDHWPISRGFEYFYGFLGGETNQFQPALYLGNHPIDSSSRDPDYIFDKDVIDRVINWTHHQQAAAPDKPFFIYLSLGTAHAPLHAPQEWIERFRGWFDHGWDEERKRILNRQKTLGIVPKGTHLSERPADIPAWHSLSDKERKVYARLMEVYAAMLAHQDAQLGRLVNELERMALASNTLIMYIEGDNGAAADAGVYGSVNALPDFSASTMDRYYDLNELANHLDLIGGPASYPALPAGWAHSLNTPFPWVKQVASHLGGIRNGLVISWPDGINSQGEIRSQFHHVIDVMPTILEAANVQRPASVDGIRQRPLDGVSMVYSFHADGESTRETQYFEMVGNRGLYHQDWFANTTPRRMPWNIMRSGPNSDTSTYEWELYNLHVDFSQSHNLARQHPEKLREMQTLFNDEAKKYNVYPIQDADALHRSLGTQLSRTIRTEFIYWGPNLQIPLAAAPPIFWVPFVIEADIEIFEENTSGVIFAAGSHFGGWSFYLNNGQPVVAAADSPLPGGLHRTQANNALPPGIHTLLFDVDWTGTGAEVAISHNDREIARGHIKTRPTTLAGSGETFDTGRDTLVPVSTDYRDEGVFPGRINKVSVRLKMFEDS